MNPQSQKCWSLAIGLLWLSTLVMKAGGADPFQLGPTAADMDPMNHFLDDVIQFRRLLGARFLVSLPPDAKIEHIYSHDRTDTMHETFATVTMTAASAQAFKKAVISQERSANLRLMWEDKDSQVRIGSIPGPHRVPESIKPWWGRPQGDTLFYVSDFRTINEHQGRKLGAVVIFMSEKLGRLWVWACEHVDQNADASAKKTA